MGAVVLDTQLVIMVNADCLLIKMEGRLNFNKPIYDSAEDAIRKRNLRTKRQS